MLEPLEEKPAVKITLDLRATAARHGILAETLSRLAYEGIIPQPDLKTALCQIQIIDEIVDRICREGLPPDRRLPYSHTVPRELVVGRPRLHHGWRHAGKSKRIKHPLNSPSYVREWFALERALAAEHASTQQAGEAAERGKLGRRPAEKIESRLAEPPPTLPHTDPPVSLFTEEEVANIFRVTVRTFREATRGFSLYVRVGRVRLYTAEDIIRLTQVLR